MSVDVSDAALLAEVWRPREFPLDVCPDCGGMGELIYGDGGGGIGKPDWTGYTLACDRCHCSGTVLPGGLACSAALP